MKPTAYIQRKLNLRFKLNRYALMVIFTFIQTMFSMQLVFTDNRVILGTRQGHLIMYSVETKEKEQEAELDLWQYDKNFSKKPVVQLAVVPGEELLFSLSDSTISVHKIDDKRFSLIFSSLKTKGTNIFCLNVSVREIFTF